MATEAPKIDYFDETTWPVIEIDVFRCCDEFHNSEIDGDGPWFLVVTKDDVKITFGYGTKEATLAAMRGLTKYVGYRYEYDIED
jgi:hypothetical protein